MELYIFITGFIIHYTAGFADFQSNVEGIYATVVIKGQNRNLSDVEVIDITECVAPRTFQRNGYIEIKGIQALIGCANIYKGRRCTGDYVTITSKKGAIVETWRDNSTAVASIGPCDQECVGTDLETRPGGSRSLVTLELLEEFQGYLTLDLQGCINMTYVGEKFGRKVKAIHFNDSLCIEFYEEENCKGESVRHMKGILNRNTITFSSWISNYGKSASTCGFNCVPPKPELTEDRKLAPLGQDVAFIYMYDRKKDQYTAKKEVSIKYGCTEIKNLTHYNDWDSLLIYKQCTIAYSTRNCSQSSDGKRLVLQNLNSLSNTHTRRLTFRVRSLKPCKYDNESSALYAVIRRPSRSNDEPMFLNVSKCQSSSSSYGVAGIGSISAYNGCINIYKTPNCRGRYISKHPGTYNGAASWDLNGSFSVGSIGPCDECQLASIPNRYGNVSRITVFNDRNYKGKRVTIGVDGCLVTPRKLNRRVVDVTDLHYICVELYENANCTGRSVQLGKGSRNLNTFASAAASGIYAAPAPSLLQHLIEPTRSVSFCGFNCNRSFEIKPSPSPTIQGPDIVTIFDDPEFTGDSKHLNLSGGCLNITDEWHGQARSILTYTKCVSLFDTPGCKVSGDNSEVKDLNLIVLKVKSVKFCPPVSEPTDIPAWQVGVVSCVILIVVVGIASVVIVRQRRRDITKLSAREIQDFLKGVENPRADGNDYVPGHGQPYDKKFEIAKDLLTVDTKTLLGFGEFAVVYKGIVKLVNNPNQESTVAVKTVKPHSSAAYTRALLKEIKTMIYVGNHNRIVQLVGCCTENLGNGELYVMIELCENGSLEKFLRNNTESFVDLCENDQISWTKWLAYVKDKTERISSSHFSTVTLMQWSLEIAEGMDFLAYKKVIHGDLAARNVLLAADFKIRISDFGISRQLYQYSQYNKKTSSPLPWRWLAIESLKTFSFSTESDVWAYGVTLWEIFSLGNTPYPEKSWDEGFVNSLSDGYRLSKPKYATFDCWYCVLECWTEKPSSRITFCNLSLKFAEILSQCSPSGGTLSDKQDKVELETA